MGPSPGRIGLDQLGERKGRTGVTVERMTSRLNQTSLRMCQPRCIPMGEPATCAPVDSNLGVPNVFLSREFMALSAEDLRPHVHAAEKCPTLDAEIVTEELLKDKVCIPITSERLRDGSVGQSGPKHRHKRVSSEDKRRGNPAGREKKDLPVAPRSSTRRPNLYDEDSLKFNPSPKELAFQRIRPTNPPLSCTASQRTL